MATSTKQTNGLVGPADLRSANGAESSQQLVVRQFSANEIPARLAEWDNSRQADGPRSLSRHPGWLVVLQGGLGHTPHCLEATLNGRVVGMLPLAQVQSVLFGRFLVSLPYLNTGGLWAESNAAAQALIDRAVKLADELNVRYLELRHETEYEHEALSEKATQKFHMRLELPAREDELWSRFKPKVRNQIRKAEKQGLTLHWGHHDRLDDFYSVFTRNMRDLGTPVYSRGLFRCILDQFNDAVEICSVRKGETPIAAALLVHGEGITEVPSASSLREFNSTNANMLMYWHLLKRSIERQQQQFDFGRSTIDSNTYRFKKQWGAEPHPAIWQYYLRKGEINEMRPDHGKYGRLIRIWRRLPVRLTEVLGPRIVRGIP